MYSGSGRRRFTPSTLTVEPCVGVAAELHRVRRSCQRDYTSRQRGALRSRELLPWPSYPG